MAPREVKVNLVARDPFALDVDAHVWLSGDEDGGVDVQCRTCDRGGEPVAWYAGLTATGEPFHRNPYDEARVPSASTIYELYRLAVRHVREVHGE